MIPTMSLHDILAIFVAGIVTGSLTTIFLTYKVKKFFKTKF